MPSRTFALALLLVAGCSSTSAKIQVIDGGPVSPYKGIDLPSALAMPHAHLMTTAGAAFDPAVESRAVTLLYTGYTSCPDVCPTTMAAVASALRGLPTAVRSQVQVEFVSTDPVHDTRPRIRTWLDRFDPSFIGLSGSRAQVAALSRSLDLPVPEDDGTTHSAELMGFVRGKGMLVAWLGEVTPSDLEHDLPLLVKKA